jgi:glycosyltransferase involved in cell wall biosynthesis
VKVLWVNTNFLHPTTKGGQIRTLEMLRHLHQRHEIHYVAIADPKYHLGIAYPEQAEGPARAPEYSAKAYPFPYRIPQQFSTEFFRQAAIGIFSPIPVAVSRFHPAGMRRFLNALIRKERFDRFVVDHLAPAAYFPDLARAVLFQHNVETVIWRRRVEHAPTCLHRWYFQLQARRMFEFERRACLAAGHIVAVSPADATAMRKLFGVTRVSEIPTGVNLEYFRQPGHSGAGITTTDLVFVGSLDWLPNVDGVLFFVREILPLIRSRRPDCSVAIVGRTPPPGIAALAESDSRIQVTRTVPDIRPYLWGAAVSIVPLRIGGGTRLKIYEAMAAGVPVVSTTIGAEGLTVHPPVDIRIADTPQDFADRCLELLAHSEERQQVANAAWEMVKASFSWERVARCFEEVLLSAPRLGEAGTP